MEHGRIAGLLPRQLLVEAEDGALGPLVHVADAAAAGGEIPGGVLGEVGVGGGAGGGGGGSDEARVDVFVVAGAAAAGVEVGGGGDGGVGFGDGDGHWDGGGW